MLELYWYVMTVYVIHDLTVDYMFHGLADDTGQGNWSVVCRVGLLTLFKDSCNVGLLPV